MNDGRAGGWLRWHSPSRSHVADETKFGLVLRELRRRAGLTQQELAERIRSTQSAIARMETGDASPRLATLEKLVDALDQDLLVYLSVGEPE